MAGRQGLEPRYADPESAVLPLDDLPEDLILTLARGVAGPSELNLSRAHAHGVLSHAGPAQILEQEDHLVLLVLAGTLAAGLVGRRCTVPAALELFDGLGQLCAATAATPSAF